MLEQAVLYVLELFFCIAFFIDSSDDFSELKIFIETLLEILDCVFSVVSKDRPIFHEDSLVFIAVLCLEHRFNLF